MKVTFNKQILTMLKRGKKLTFKDMEQIGVARPWDQMSWLMSKNPQIVKSYLPRAAGQRGRSICVYSIPRGRK